LQKVAYTAVLSRNGDIFTQKYPGGDVDHTSPIKPLNHGDLNRAASTNSGSSHQYVEISCENSAPKSIIEWPHAGSGSLLRPGASMQSQA